MTREEFISMMGYSDNSPLRNAKSLSIQTGDNGIIDMTNTGIPLMANNRYLPPYSGYHQFAPNSTVTEIPLRFGGSLPKFQGLTDSEVAEKYQPVVDWYSEYLRSGTFDHLKNKIIDNAEGNDKGWTQAFFDAGEEQGLQYLNDYPYKMRHADYNWDPLEEPVIIGPSIQEKYTGTRGRHSHTSGNHTTTKSGITIDPLNDYWGPYNEEQQLGIMAHELGHTEGGLFTGDKLLASEINKRNKAYQKVWNELSEEEKQNFIDNPHELSWWLSNNYHKPGFHNAQPKEVRSDLIRFRYQADKEGIYNSSGEYVKFTEDDLKKMKEAYPGNRLFKNFTDEDIIWLMDNVADATDQIGDDIPGDPRSVQFGGSLPKFQDINSETELNQYIEDLDINTLDVDDKEQKDFQKTKVSSEEWLNRVMREQEDRGNPVTREQAIEFQTQALSDLDQGVVKSQTWDEFFDNPLNQTGLFDLGTQGFNITQPSVWDPITQTFKADPSGQMSNTMLINDIWGNDPNPWTFAHETGHNWNWRNPFNNDPSRQFIGNTYFGKDNMFNKFNPDYTSDDFDHDRGGLGTTNVGDFGQYQQAAPELRSEKAALEKELFDLGLYDPTQPFTEQHLRDILDSGNLSSEAREVLDGLGYKELLKERHDVIQATNNSERSGLPTDLREKREIIERMYSELGSRYATNADLGSDQWGNMYESERERHNEEFGTTPREVSDGWGGTETREMSDLEYESYLRNQKWRADQELYGQDAVYGETSLTGGIQSPGYFAYDMENISDANTTLTGYMDDFLNAHPETPMLREVKNIEGIIIGYSDDPNYSGIGTPDNMMPYSSELKAQYDNQSPGGGPTEEQWNTYVDGLFSEEESYNTDDPESTSFMKIDESLDYTWPAEEGDDDYDPDNIQKNNNLWELCWDEDGKPTGNPDCTEAHIKRLEDNQARHNKHRKIDQLSYNANSIVDLFGESTSIHVENATSLFDMSGGVAKTGPNSPIIEAHYSEMFPEGTPEYDARQRLISTMNKLREKNEGKSADLDRESLTPKFIQDMKLVEDALIRTRNSLQEKRQGLVDEYYQGVDKYRSTDHKQLIIEQQEELDNELKDNNITNFMNRVYSQNDQEISDGLPPTINARYGTELPRFQKKGEYDWEIATEKSIYPDGEYNWYNPADSWRYLTNESETIPIPPPPPEDPKSAKNKSEIPLSWDEYKIEKPKGTIEQYRKYIRNPKYNDWRMHSFNPNTNITKKGWVNKEYYRGLDKESVGEVQEWLIENGYDIKKDSSWGDETYNALNNYLLDSKLLNKEITTDPLLTDDLLITQQYIESDGKPKAGSNKGALGLVQAMPDAWKDAIKKGILPENADRTNINHALVFQRYYMNSLMNAEFVTDATSDNEQLARALSAYNWGRGNTPRFFNNINYVATNETIKNKDGKIIEKGFRNKLDKDGNPILVPKDERRDPNDMKSWMKILDSSKDDTRWTIPQETVDYINLIMFPEQYIKDHGKTKYESRIKSTKKFEDYKKKAKGFYSYKEGGSLNRTKQLIRTYKLGGELSGLAIKHLEEIGIIPKYKEGGTTYNINDEETLLGIAKEYNTTEKNINKYNNLIDTEPLYKGQVIDIPKPIVKTPLEIKKEAHKLGDYGIFKNMPLDTQIKLYSNYVNGNYIMFSEKLGKKLYDKLNRVYYDKARVLNMSVLDYMKSILS